LERPSARGLTGGPHRPHHHRGHRRLLASFPGLSFYGRYGLPRRERPEFPSRTKTASPVLDVHRLLGPDHQRRGAQHPFLALFVLPAARTPGSACRCGPLSPHLLLACPAPTPFRVRVIFLGPSALRSRPSTGHPHHPHALVRPSTPSSPTSLVVQAFGAVAIVPVPEPAAHLTSVGFGRRDPWPRLGPEQFSSKPPFQNGFRAVHPRSWWLIRRSPGLTAGPCKR